MTNLDLIYTITQDKLRLFGVYYQPDTKSDTCLIVVHGMSGNILENYCFDVLGKTLASGGIASIYAHNRGYGHVNDIKIMDTSAPDGGYQSTRIGVKFERFEDCVKDIGSWIQSIEKLGYSKIILLGHSLGAPKVIHYIYRKQPKNIIGVALVSPADVVGLGNLPKHQPNYPDLLVEAKKYVAEGKPRQVLSSLIWNYYQLSAQTFLDLFTEDGPADILPIYRNPDKFPQLASITTPILCITGEKDDSIIRTVEKDQALIEQKAISCRSFSKMIISGANHTYDKKEKEFSNEILKWTKTL